MGFKCGIVGLPNVGKSTLFNALTKASIPAENYPFCTIDPNVGVVPLPDPRLNAISEIVKPKSIIPTTMQFVDIAGLVSGASKGEGLGNKFLANIRETDAIAHVVRCFEHTDVIHVTGTINPVADIATINTELALADLETVEKAIEKVNRQSKSGDKNILRTKELYERLRDHIDKGKPVRNMDMTDDEKKDVKNLFLLTNKPVLYIANVSENGLVKNPYLDALVAFAAEEGTEVVPVCAAIESEIIELDESERKEFLNDLGLDEPGLNRVVRAGYKLLGLETYFTAGEKEVRAWTIPEKATAPQAAGAIHTDFQRGFIRAEVISYIDFIQFKGEQGAREAGKLRSEGKDYIVQDGDVIHFRFNV